MRTLILFLSLVPLSFGQLIFSGDSDEEDDSFYDTNNDDNCRCSSSSDPVCGVDGRTYLNECKADCEGKRVDCNGRCPCNNDYDDSNNNDGGNSGVCLCPFVNDPVCGEDGRDYTSRCQAECNDARVDCQGRCPCNGNDDNNNNNGGQCGCSGRRDPVCSREGTTYRNECRAKCHGAKVDCYGKCPCDNNNNDSNEESCDQCLDERFDPVCGVNGMTFRNRCQVRCRDVDMDCQGSCPCPGSSGEEDRDCDECSSRADPVCGDNNKPFRNRCHAECRGFKVKCDGRCPCPDDSDEADYYGEKDDDDDDDDDYNYFYDYEEDCDDCPRGLDRVCGDDGETYDNKCKARCRNVKVKCEGRCPCRNSSDEDDDDDDSSEDCTCSNTFAPVCSTRGITFSNACRARCASKTVGCEGECPCDLDRCGCDDRDDPVCGTNGRSYANTCKAECDETSVDCDGQCPCERNPRCECGFTFAPVCGEDDYSYSNAGCAKTCGKTRVRCRGECPCDGGEVDAKRENRGGNGGRRRKNNNGEEEDEFPNGRRKPEIDITKLFGEGK